MPFSEEIVKTAFSALLENQIATVNGNSEYVIPETFDNAASNFLTMLHYYDLSLCVWNFHNGRYDLEKALSMAVLKVASMEELFSYNCPDCEFGSCAHECRMNHSGYSSLQHFVEVKDTLGQRWLALQLIEKALTVLKKAACAYTQVSPQRDTKKTRSISGIPLLSPNFRGIKKVHIGKFFYNEYYPKSFDEFERCDTSYFINQNKLLCELKLDQYNPEIEEFKNDQLLKHQTYSENHFSFLATSYGDGFFCGAGIPHDFGFPQAQGKNADDDGKHLFEFLLGMYFDPTSGLPVLPGESFKGTLRSSFEEKPEIVYEIIQALGITFADKTKIELQDISTLLEELFDFPDKSEESNEFTEPLNRNEFLTCFPVKSLNTKGKFLERDTITAHDDSPLKSPQASIPFLKVLPDVVFQFNLILTDGLINKKDKLSLIKELLKDIGLGAKSRRGFGKFEFLQDIDFK